MKRYRYTIGTKDPKLSRYANISSSPNNPDRINRRINYNKPKFMIEQEILEDLKNTYKGEFS